MKKAISVILVLVMIITAFSTSIFAASPTDIIGRTFADMPQDWSRTPLSNAVANGLLTGYNGKIMPKDDLTRAQMAAVVNRAFGTTERASLDGYTDVSPDAWYSQDMEKAVQMGTLVGYGTKLNPDGMMTREEAFVALSRAFKLSGAAASTLDKFTDKASVSTWAIDGVASLVSAGYVEGANGLLNPKKNITRAECAQIMDKLLSRYITSAGTYSIRQSGNVMINAPDVILKNTVITGDLIIGDGVGDGDVTLDGVTVSGRTLIRGGGVNSIKITGNSVVRNITVARVDGVVRVFSDDGTEIGEVIIDGKDDVIVEGNVHKLTVIAPDVTVMTENATIRIANIMGPDSKIIVGSDSNIYVIGVFADNCAVTALAGSEISFVEAMCDGLIVNGDGNVGTVCVEGDGAEITTSGTTAYIETDEMLQAALLSGGGPLFHFSPDEGGVGGGPGGGGGGLGSWAAPTPTPRPSGGGSVAVSAITVTGASDAITVTNGSTLQMNATVTPANATNKTVTWSVAALSGGTATIDAATGVLTGTGVGTVTVTATNAASGVAGTKVITVVSSEKAITATTVGTLTGGNITAVPAGTTVGALKAGLTVSTAATVEILAGTGGVAVTSQAATAVTATMVIKVTAQDLTTAEYTIAMVSSDATLKVTSTVKGQTVIGLGTPNAILAGVVTAGAVTISTAKAADTSNLAPFITLFDKTNKEAKVKVVKYTKDGNTSGFGTDIDYTTAAVANKDFFIIRVTAEDGTTVLYYKITVTLPEQAVGEATATVGTDTIAYTLTTGKFAEEADGMIYWIIAGTNGDELGDVETVVLSEALTVATITVTFVVVTDKVYTIAPAQAAFASDFAAPDAVNVILKTP